MGEWATVLGAENCGRKVWYDAKGSEGGPAGIQRRSVPTYRFGRLFVRLSIIVLNNERTVDYLYPTSVQVHSLYIILAGEYFDGTGDL